MVQNWKKELRDKKKKLRQKLYHSRKSAPSQFIHVKDDLHTSPVLGLLILHYTLWKDL